MSSRSAWATIKTLSQKEKGPAGENAGTTLTACVWPWGPIRKKTALPNYPLTVIYVYLSTHTSTYMKMTVIRSPSLCLLYRRTQGFT